MCLLSEVLVEFEVVSKDRGAGLLGLGTQPWFENTPGKVEMCYLLFRTTFVLLIFDYMILGIGATA